MTCIDDTTDFRNFLIWANDLGMTTTEWVYVMPRLTGQGMQFKSEQMSFLKITYLYAYYTSKPGRFDPKFQIVVSGRGRNKNVG